MSLDNIHVTWGEKTSFTNIFEIFVTWKNILLTNENEPQA